MKSKVVVDMYHSSKDISYRHAIRWNRDELLC